VKRVGRDTATQPLRYDPTNPASNLEGYVKTPNINSVTEVMDMREAERSYSANLSILQVIRNMLNRTIDLLR
jgi:flagellar basal-body rod protein FlgC